MKIIKHGSKYSEDKNSNFSLEAKFESMIKIAKKIINQNKNNTGDCSIETALAYDVANYLPKVLKENEILKKEKEQAWEEWNNLDQGSYEAEQKLKQQLKKLQKENEELKFEERSRIIGKYGDAEIHDVINRTLSNDYIPIQKVKDKIEEILNNGEYTIIFEGDADFADEATRIDAQKYIKLEKLQELLEGRKI